MEPYKTRIEFNLPLRKHKLKKQIQQQEHLTEIISQYADESESAREKCIILALTGWRCARVEADEGEEENQLENFMVECTSCFVKVHSRLMDNTESE